MKEHHIKYENILSIEYGPRTDSLVQYKPIEQNIRPRDKHSAQFSVPWLLACAAVRQKLGVVEFDEDALLDKDLLACAAKCVCIDELGSAVPFAELPVVIKTTEGVFETNTGCAYGDPKNPMSFDSMVEKFENNVKYGLCTKKEKIDELKNLIIDLDECGNIDVLVKKLEEM